MKGKLTTRTIILSIIAVVLLGVAVTGSVIFLRDSGEAAAVEEQNVLPVTGNDNEENPQGTPSSEEEEEGLTNEEDNPGTTTRDEQNTVPERTGTTGETTETNLPEATTVEQERVVSETTAVSWSNMPVVANYNKRNINYNNLRYTVEYYYERELDESKTDVIGNNKPGDEITTFEDKPIIGYEFKEATISEEDPLIISEKEKENIIKVYYVKSSFEYTIYHVEKDNETNILDTDTGSAKYEDKITVNKKDILGYTYDSKNKELIKIATTGNIAYVYYTKKAEPVLKLTKTSSVTSLVYDPSNEDDNTFTYTLKVENTVKNSYPEKIAEKTVEDVLPAGIKVDLTENRLTNLGIEKETVTVDGKSREKLTWTVSDIGYGDAAKSVNIPVIVEKSVFTGQEVDLGTTTSVLDITLSQDTKNYPDRYLNSRNDVIYGDYNKVKDTSKTKVNLFIRSAGATNKNNGYIYAGSSTIGTVPTGEIFASNTYNTRNKIDVAINNNNLSNMLDDFVRANENGKMSKYISGGLPSKEQINANLNTLYNGTIQLSDTQVVLWYLVCNNDDARLKRYYIINDNGRNLFKNYVILPECYYHLDGIVVDITSLGTEIPKGAQVNVSNTATIESDDLEDSCQVTIYYKEQPTTKSTVNTNLLTAIIKDESINVQTYSSLKKAINTADIKDNESQKTINNEISNNIKNENKEINNNISLEEKEEENIVNKEVVDDKGSEDEILDNKENEIENTNTDVSLEAEVENNNNSESNNENIITNNTESDNEDIADNNSETDAKNELLAE